MSVRPTPDRVRETLFNWLAPMIEGSRCLDLFAGSGVLGIEALSRGAKHVDFIEIDSGTRGALEKNLMMLDAHHQASIHAEAADQFLAKNIDAERGWDVVFIDAPFGQGMVNPALAKIGARLLPGHRVYVEQEFPAKPELPAQWQVLREKRAGQLIYRLLQFANAESTTG